MLDSNSDLNKDLKKSLEKKYFNLSFEKIRKHPQFKTLKLTDEEIIENRSIIKSALQSFNTCGESQKLCCSIDPHYTLKKNSDGKLLLVEFNCLKLKDIENIENIEKKVDRNIQQLLTSHFYKFTYKDIQENLKKLEEYDSVKETIKNLGNPEFILRNVFISTSEDRKAFANIFAYHYILLGKKITVIRSEEVKKLLIQNFTNLKEEEQIDEEYPDLKDTDNLIIVDLGLESSFYKEYYYLDLLEEFLSHRKTSNKTTYIISPIEWKEIEEEINKTIKRKENVTPSAKYKLDNLKNIMEELFTRLA